MPLGVGSTFLPGPGPLITVPVNESVRSAAGTHVAEIIGRFEFQGFDVVEARALGGASNDDFDLFFLFDLLA